MFLFAVHNAWSVSVVPVRSFAHLPSTTYPARFASLPVVSITTVPSASTSTVQPANVYPVLAGAVIADTTALSYVTVALVDPAVVALFPSNVIVYVSAVQ